MHSRMKNSFSHVRKFGVSRISGLAISPLCDIQTSIYFPRWLKRVAVPYPNLF